MPNDSSLPRITINQEQAIDLSIPQTESVRTSAGNTYNQAGFSYNQTGVIYEGISNPNLDLVAMSFQATTEPVPHDILFNDNYIVLPNTNHSIGPGWFMFVTIR